MHQPSIGTTATTAFIVRFWREWAGAESRWRGRIEHVESGQQASFLQIVDLLDFFQRFGIATAALPVSRSASNGAPEIGEPGVIDSSCW